MSFIDFRKMAKSKRQTTIMKKTKFRKQDKTKKCSIPKCPNPAIHTVKISFKEIRKLCKLHYTQYQNGKLVPPAALFTKASDLIE